MKRESAQCSNEAHKRSQRLLQAQNWRILRRRTAKWNGEEKPDKRKYYGGMIAKDTLIPDKALLELAADINNIADNLGKFDKNINELE